MPFWFGKKKLGVTPGGSTVLRYGSQAREPAIGFSEVQETEAREAAYDRLFGYCETVSHEVVPLVPHIDVYAFLPNDQRKFCTLVTGGMSDCPMDLPRQVRGQVSRRVELVFYCDAPRQEYIETLRWLAHFPHDYKTWVGHGHTIPNGNPPEPFWGSEILDSMLLMPPIVNQDRTLPQELTVDGDPVDLLWVVPLSQKECDLKLAKGVNAIYDLFQKNRHPHVFDPGRKSYC